MMQKIVIRLPTVDEKCRSRALKVAVEITGVESAAVEGEEMVVTGVGIDWERLIQRLKKKFGDAELVGFRDAEDEHQPIPPFPAAEQPVMGFPAAEQPVMGMVAPPIYGLPQYRHCQDNREPSCCNPCTIM